MNRPDKLPDSTYLSTIQVAKAVGVSVTTIKRWVDEGILPAHRTAGGHRKLLLADVLRLSRENGFPQADLRQLALPNRNREADPAHFRTQLLEAIRAEELDRIRSIVSAAHRSGLAIPQLADEVIAPAMKFVGEQWQHGKVNVSHEHLITQAVVGALYEIRAAILPAGAKDRPIALGGSIERDHYILPSLLAKLTLLEIGWNAINIGPNTPASAFQFSMESLKPRLVWISVSHIENVEQFELDYNKLYEVAHSRGIPLSLGGRALCADLRSRLPYTTYGDRFGQLAAFARTLNPLPTRPKRGRPTTGD